jgi:hypothetical protein
MGVSLEYGPTDLPLEYDPPVPIRRAPGRHAAQAGEPLEVPILMMTSESSVFTQIDPHTYEYVKACGCDIEYITLPQAGVRGNGHGMMLREEQPRGAPAILDWLAKKL